MHCPGSTLLDRDGNRDSEKRDNALEVVTCQ